MNKTRTTFLLLLLALVVLGGGWWYTYATLDAASGALTNKLAAERAHMQELLRLLERSEGDNYANAVIRDCPSGERRVFDDLLSRLDAGITPAELDRLEMLYYRCADFYAVRRHLMALRLEESVREHGELRTVAQTLPTFDDTAVPIEEWERIAVLEREKSEYFTELVGVQGRIITELQAGNAAESPVITKLQQEAQELQEQIGAATIEINALKPTLADL